MSLIDSSYFHGPLVIPNLGSSGFAASSLGDRLNGFIDFYEASLLKSLLGETLYSEFINGLEADDPLDKWLDLKDQLVDEENLLSPIASWVYYHSRRTMATLSTGIGEIIPATENGSMTDLNFKLVSAWNDTRAGIMKVIEFLVDNFDDYPDWELFIYTGIPDFDDLVETGYLSVQTLELTPFNRIGI